MRTEKPEIVQHYVELLIRLLWDTADQLGLKHSFFHKDIASLKRGVDRKGLQFLTEDLPSLGKAFDRALALDGEFVVPDGFKTINYGSTKIPVFLGFLWKLIFTIDGRVRQDDYDGADKRMLNFLTCHRHEEHESKHQIIAVRAVRQILYLAYKLRYPYAKDKREKRIQSFIEIDNSLPEEDSDALLSPEAYRAITNAKVLISYVLRRINPLESISKHGPGSVATGEKYEKKYKFSHYYPELDKKFCYADFFFSNYGHLAHDLDVLQNMRHINEAVASVRLVPKDSRGPRLISMEPLELQWIQQGLKDQIVREIEHPDSLTAGFVNFTDQSINRRLAKLHSIPSTEQFVTLDMADASDRVSLWLVKRLFPPYLYEYLKACRSPLTELPDGRCWRLKKFASMGSAVCFPVEALIFWALAVGSVVDVCRLKGLLRTPPPIYVYGDDIICRKTDYERIRPVFEELCLKFSEDKCCIGRFFRESCGCDAFKGEDVTPVKLHCCWPARWSPKSLLSYVSYANELRCGEGRYIHTSDYLEECIYRQFGSLPIVDMEANYSLAFKRRFCSREETLKSLESFKYRWNRYLQRKEWKLRSCFSHAFERAPDSDWSRLFSLNQKYSDAFGFSEYSPFDVYTVLHTVNMEWTWIASDLLLRAEA